MDQKINQIREMELIEKELREAKVGVLAFSDGKQNVRQIVTPFVYFDKNLFFNNTTDENFQLTIFDDTVNFSVYRELKLPNKEQADFAPSFKYIQIKCSGLLKKIEEQKVVDEVIKTFRSKYKTGNKEDKQQVEKLLFIDTEEIQASEIIGG